MVPTVSSQQNRRAEVRWQDRVIACFWMPFSLLFHIWVYFTPTYEEKGGLLQPSQSRPHSRPLLQHSSILVALVVTSVLGFTLFALMTLPPLASRLLLILAFGFSLWQLMRPKT
jgi:hypothetical protein